MAKKDESTEKDLSHLRLEDPDGEPYQAGSAADWHNCVARGYKPLGDGPDDNTEQTAASEPAKTENKPVSGGFTATGFTSS